VVRDDTVITGLGVMAPTGISMGEYWSGTIAGYSALAPISRFPVDGYPIKLAGEIAETIPGEERLSGRLNPQTDRTTRMSLLAAAEALADSGLDLATEDPFDVGVAVATETGGLEFGQRQLQKLWSEGWESVSAYMSFAWYYAVNTGQISISNGAKGPGGVVLSEQSSGLDSLAFGRRQIRKGTGIMLCGGFDSMICPYGIAILSTAKGYSTSADRTGAYRPFSASAAGWVTGEGGAVCVLESAAHAAARGKIPYAVLSGYAATFDPNPRAPSGDGLRRALIKALADAELPPDAIDLVMADGQGVADLDHAEANVLSEVFGNRGVPVCVPKTGTGRLLAGAGPVDVVTALLCMREGKLPPAPHLDAGTLDDRLDVVTGEPRAREVRHAVVLSRGSGGSASAMVLSCLAGR
jgi:minimal PKS chain-length factor (CLF/KS beta)